MATNYEKLVKTVFGLCQNPPKDPVEHAGAVLDAVKEYETAEATALYLKTLTQSQRERYQGMGADALPEAMRRDFYTLSMDGTRGPGAVALSGILSDFTGKVDFERAARMIREEG